MFESCSRDVQDTFIKSKRYVSLEGWTLSRYIKNMAKDKRAFVYGLMFLKYLGCAWTNSKIDTEADR